MKALALLVWPCLVGASSKLIVDSYSYTVEEEEEERLFGKINVH